MRRRRRYGRRRFNRKPRSMLGTAAKALSVALSVKKMLNVEHKFVDTLVSAAGATAGLVSPLSLVAQGVTENQREGDKIKATHLSIKFILAPSSTQSFLETFRFIVFKDKVSNGVVPTAAQLLQDTSAGVNQAFSHYNPDNCPSRFHILMDKLLYSNVAGSGNQEPTIFFLEHALNHHLTYTGATAVQANADTGQLYLYVQCDNVAGGQATYVASARMSYVDN